MAAALATALQQQQPPRGAKVWPRAERAKRCGLRNSSGFSAKFQKLETNRLLE